jgi:ABC-2 type transport system permease protein
MMAYGAVTLFRKEVRRFFRVPGQTILSPVITTVLYLVVFGSALGGRLREVNGVPYLTFIVPGLIMLGVISNSFLNTSSSFFVMKIQGTIVDILVSPLSYGEVVWAMVSASVVRAMIVGFLTWVIAVIAQGQIQVAHVGYALAFPILTAVGMGALGLLAGIWADKFEQINFVPTFVVTPLTFLGGVFYDVSRLPPAFAKISHVNPVLYLVEGERYGLIGASSVSPNLGLAILLAIDAVSLVACLIALRSGWKLRT